MWMVLSIERCPSELPKPNTLNLSALTQTMNCNHPPGHHQLIVREQFSKKEKKPPRIFQHLLYMYVRVQPHQSTESPLPLRTQNQHLHSTLIHSTPFNFLSFRQADAPTPSPPTSLLPSPFLVFVETTSSKSNNLSPFLCTESLDGMLYIYLRTGSGLLYSADHFKGKVESNFI
jgi:hypothetical protein